MLLKNLRVLCKKGKENRERWVYLASTHVHCKTPATPVQEDGVSGSKAS